MTSSQLTKAQVDAFLDGLKGNPDKARRFLFEAGFIDEDGQLTLPYRPIEED